MMASKRVSNVRHRSSNLVVFLLVKTLVNKLCQKALRVGVLVDQHRDKTATFKRANKEGLYYFPNEFIWQHFDKNLVRFGRWAAAVCRREILRTFFNKKMRGYFFGAFADVGANRCETLVNFIFEHLIN